MISYSSNALLEGLFLPLSREKLHQNLFKNEPVHWRSVRTFYFLVLLSVVVVVLWWSQTCRAIHCRTVHCVCQRIITSGVEPLIFASLAIHSVCWAQVRMEFWLAGSGTTHQQVIKGNKIVMINLALLFWKLITMIYRGRQMKPSSTSTTIVRELKQRRRWRHRERQKSNRSILAKQQLCTCITRLCTFLCRRCATSTWNWLNSRFVEDVNTRQRFLQFFSLT